MEKEQNRVSVQHSMHFKPKHFKTGLIISVWSEMISTFNKTPLFPSIFWLFTFFLGAQSLMSTQLFYSPVLWLKINTRCTGYNEDGLEHD